MVTKESAQCLGGNIHEVWMIQLIYHPLIYNKYEAIAFNVAGLTVETVNRMLASSCQSITDSLLYL